MTTPRLPMGGFTCEETYARLAAYRDLVLPEAEHDKVAAHLRVCETCAPLMASFDRVHAALRAEGSIAAPAGLWAAAQSRLEADDLAVELPGTWPVPETEAERIRRLSKFSTRRVSTRDPEAETIPAEALADGRAQFPWPIPDDDPVPVLPRTLSDAPALPSAPELVKRQESSKAFLARVTRLYATGIAAMVVLALFIGQLAKQFDAGPSRDDVIVQAPRSYVEALLAVNLRTYRKLPDPSAQGVETFIAQQATWSPIVFPALGEYQSAAVWQADGREVACAVLELEGRQVAVMCSPWQAGEMPSGSERLSAVSVENFEFQLASEGDRHLAMWTHTWDNQTLLYSLLVIGDIETASMQDLALTTLLEIQQREREQSGNLPG